MFIRWNKGCLNIAPFNRCNYYQESDYLPIVSGETYVMKDETVIGDVVLYNSKTGASLGNIRVNIPPMAEPSLRIRISNINSNSIFKIAVIQNCIGNCTAPLYRSSFSTDTAFLNAIANAITSIAGGTYFIQNDTIEITFNQSTGGCAAMFTANTNFANVSGVCNKPNIITDCVFPVINNKQTGNCAPAQNCLDMVQLQGFSVCIAILSQPECINTEGYFAIRIPESIEPGECYYLRNANRCSQQLISSCADCYSSLVRARNFNEPYTQIRLPIELHSKRIIGGGEISRIESKRIKREVGFQETAYTLTTDYLLPDIHFAIANIAQKDKFQIYQQYEPYENERWEGFVLNGEYEIKYPQMQPKPLIGQGEANILVNKFIYTNLP